jgi:hypothetical protein
MQSVTDKINGSGETYTRLAVLEQKLDSHMEADEKFQAQALDNQKRVEGWIEKLFLRIKENQEKSDESIEKVRASVDSMKMPVYMAMGIGIAIPTAIEIYRLMTGK